MTRRGGYFRFFRSAVWPRARSVFLHANVISALTSGICVVAATGVLDFNAPFDRVKFVDLGTASLAFAALSFGGAMTSAALALTLPADRLMRTMVVNSVAASRKVRIVRDRAIYADDETPADKSEYPRGYRSLYSDLVFVFLLTGYAQLILAVASMACMALVGESPLVSTPRALGTSIALGVMVSASAYAILQLATALKAVMSVAVQRDAFLRMEVLSHPPQPAAEGNSIAPPSDSPRGEPAP